MKSWEKWELCRQGIIEFILAMVEVEFFVELDPEKDKFESFKPKRTNNGGRDHKEEGQVKHGYGDNSKNGGNRKPLNGKWKPNNKSKGLVKCFFCDSPHIMRDCLKKFGLSAIKEDDELN